MVKYLPCRGSSGTLWRILQENAPFRHRGNPDFSDEKPPFTFRKKTGHAQQDRGGPFRDRAMADIAHR